MNKEHLQALKNKQAALSKTYAIIDKQNTLLHNTIQTLTQRHIELGEQRNAINRRIMQLTHRIKLAEAAITPIYFRESLYKYGKVIAKQNSNYIAVIVCCAKNNQYIKRITLSDSELAKHMGASEDEFDKQFKKVKSTICILEET